MAQSGTSEVTRQRDAHRNLRGTLLHQRLFEAPERLSAVPAQDGIGKNPGTAAVRSWGLCAQGRLINKRGRLLVLAQSGPNHSCPTMSVIGGEADVDRDASSRPLMTQLGHLRV